MRSPLHKDRNVTRSASLLEPLRAWCRRRDHKAGSLGRDPAQPITPLQPNRACHAAAEAAGSIRTCLHAAPPQLRRPLAEQNVDVRVIQVLSSQHRAPYAGCQTISK